MGGMHMILITMSAVLHVCAYPLHKAAWLVAYSFHVVRLHGLYCNFPFPHHHAVPACFLEVQVQVHVVPPVLCTGANLSPAGIDVPKV